MNIEPLEIKQHFFATNHYIDEVDVRQLEANYKEAIEALDKWKQIADIVEDLTFVPIARLTESIIEKATGKKWSDLF